MTLKYLFKQNQLNVWQGKWLESITNINFDIYYHPNKADIVAEAFNQKSYETLRSLRRLPKELAEDIVRHELKLIYRSLVRLDV